MTYGKLQAAAPEDLANVPGTDAYLLEQLGHGKTTILTIGADVTGAEVVDDWVGSAAGADPKAATIVYLDGPLSPVAYAAAEHGGRDRILPALRQVPGVIRLVTLWDPTARSIASIVLADSIETLEEAARVVNSTTLLPDEDPALLPGPDRADMHRVVQHRTLQPTRKDQS
jgi:hypothetical protein